MRKGPDSGADVVVFDLEDAVAPDRKAAAREAVADVLTDPGFDPDCEVVVRVTGRESEADLDAVLAGEPRLEALMLPKAESGADVDALAAAAAERGADLPVFALCETAAGVLHAESIATANATTAVLFGAEDLSADVGATRTEEGTEVLYAREHVVLAAATAGVDAVDTLVTDIDALDRLRGDAAFARDLGYNGKIAVHPSQVPVINDAFRPDEERVEWARRVIDAVENRESEGVVRVDGEMIDAPLVSQAQRILDRANER